MNKVNLIIGDVLAILLTTLIGFATHGEVDLSFLPRMAVAFFPLVITWFLLALWLGLFQDEITRNARQLWRPVLTMLFAAPFAAVIRGALLASDVKPIFVLTFGLTSAFGVTMWRGLWIYFWRKRL